MNERVKHDGIYARGRGSWRIVVSTGRDPVTGVYGTIRETVRGTKTDARRRRNELLVDVGRGTVARDDGETVAAYLERWIGHRERMAKVRPTTARTYRGYIANHVTPKVGHLRLTDVRPVHLQRVLDDALTDGLSARSVLQVHHILHAAFRQAVRWRNVTVNPADGVTPPEAKDPKVRPLSPADITKVLAKSEDPFRAPLAMLAATGMRRGELAALRWEGVDLEADQPYVRVEGTLQRVGKVLQVLEPKTERARRVVPLPASIVSVLRRAKKEQKKRRLIVGPAWNDEGYVFDRADGRPFDPDELTRAFRRARARANLDGARLHDLRHAWATMQMEAGTNPRVVSDVLGHRHVSFTMQTYSHPDMKMTKPAMDAVDAALGDALK